jgi:hypothetical protein
MLVKISIGIHWALSLVDRDVPEPNLLRSTAYVKPLYR